MRTAVIALILSLLSACAGKGSLGRYTIASGSVSGVNHLTAGALVDILDTNRSAVQLKRIATPDSAANVELLASKTVDFALIRSDILYYASTGTVMFGNSYTNLYAIASLNTELCHILARTDIETISGLNGRTIAVGSRGSATEQAARQILQAAEAMSEGTVLRNMTFLESRDALNSGEIDAVIFMASLPTDIVSETLRSGSVHLLGMDSSLINRLTTAHPCYIQAEISEIYYGVPHPIRTIAAKTVLVARADLSADICYELTYRLFEHRDSLAEQTDFKIDPHSAVEGFGTALHPGALALYTEIGVLTIDEESY